MLFCKQSLPELLYKDYITENLNKFPIIQKTERMGFEPMRPFGQTVFKTASL